VLHLVEVSLVNSLPVIATNWSGCTEFLDNEVAYPIQIEGTEQGDVGEWAVPSLSDLKRQMRMVVADPERAREKGRQARRKIVEHYDQSVVAELVLERLKAVYNKLQQGV
jgi:glycosyltransferase involved in cell wall biosynthesis